MGHTRGQMSSLYLTAKRNRRIRLELPVRAATKVKVHDDARVRLVGFDDQVRILAASHRNHDRRIRVDAKPRLDVATRESRVLSLTETHDCRLPGGISEIHGSSVPRRR